MRTALVLVVAALAPAWAAAAPEKMYYLGEVKLTSGAGKPMGSQVILVEKTHDPDHSLIVERAVVVQPDGKVEEYTARLAVKADNSFTLTDDARGAEGAASSSARPGSGPTSRRSSRPRMASSSTTKTSWPTRRSAPPARS